MLARFEGGPYDGAWLDHNEVSLYCKLVPKGGRYFLVLPAIAQWDAVRRGERGVFDLRSPTYELIQPGDGIAAIYDPNCQRLAAAQREATATGDKSTDKGTGIGQVIS